MDTLTADTLYEVIGALSVEVGTYADLLACGYAPEYIHLHRD